MVFNIILLSLGDLTRTAACLQIGTTSYLALRVVPCSATAMRRLSLPHWWTRDDSLPLFPPTNLYIAGKKEPFSSLIC